MLRCAVCECSPVLWKREPRPGETAVAFLPYAADALQWLCSQVDRIFARTRPVRFRHCRAAGGTAKNLQIPSAWVGHVGAALAGKTTGRSLVRSLRRACCPRQLKILGLRVRVACVRIPEAPCQDVRYATECSPCKCVLTSDADSLPTFLERPATASSPSELNCHCDHDEVIKEAALPPSGDRQNAQARG